MQIRASLTSAKLTDVDIPYDVNPDLENVIIIDCVKEVQGRALGIDMAAKARRHCHPSGVPPVKRVDTFQTNALCHIHI